MLPTMAKVLQIFTSRQVASRYNKALTFSWINLSEIPYLEHWDEVFEKNISRPPLNMYVESDISLVH